MFGISIITLIILAFVFFILFKITKVIWKAILFTFLILVLFLGLLGYLVYSDVQSIINEEKKIFIVSEKQVLTGTSFIDFQEQTNYFTNSELNTYTEHYKEEDYKKMLGEAYLLLIIKTDIFEDIGDTLVIQNETISKKEVLNMLSANNTQEFIQIASQVSENITSSDSVTQDEMIEYKFKLIAAILKESLEET